MKKNTSIKLKAALLLVVFGLNTAVGFACAMGIDMGFNSTQHYDEEATEVQVHANGGKNEHHNKPANHCADEKNKEKKGGCCNDSVIKFLQTDKSVPQSNTVISPIFFATFIFSYYNINILYSSQVTGCIKYFVRSYHPPISDLRIAIQSFQI